MPDLLTRDQAQALAGRVLEQVTADGAQVNLRAGVAGHTRFARNEITTAGDAADTEVTVTVRFGRRSAAVTFNHVDDEAAIAQAVAQAQELAQVAPEDPEQMPLLGPQEHMEVPAYFDATADVTPAARADTVAGVAEPAAQAGLVATGFLEQRAEVVAVANSAGLFAYHRTSAASLTTTIRTSAGDGSGWAGTTHNAWTRLTPPAALAGRAIEKARASAGAADVTPGLATVVLEPTAVGNLLQLLRGGLDARAADEGRSAFARRGGGNRIGERVVDARVTIFSDPADADVLEQPFTDEGLPVGRTTWIENGVLRHLAYSRHWAEHQGVTAVPLAGGLKMVGGAGSAADLVAGVETGILVTRFWYIRGVDPRTLTFTGLTRDGTFLIENGRVTRPVKNLRFNESIVALLQNVVAVGAAERVVASESGGLGAAVVVPPLVVRNFRFTAVSDAV